MREGLERICKLTKDTSADSFGTLLRSIEDESELDSFYTNFHWTQI